MGVNGSPLQFPDKAVPIVGQRYALHTVAGQAMLLCTCEARTPVLLRHIGDRQGCPACKTVFLLRGVTINPTTDECGAFIETGVMVEPPKV